MLIKSFSSASSTARWRLPLLSKSTQRRSVRVAVGGAVKSTFGFGFALTKVFRSKSSSLSRKAFFCDTSFQPTVIWPKSLAVNRCSYSPSCFMKVTLISKSGLLEFKNSSVLIMDQLYLRIKKVASTHDERLWPRTEWTKTLWLLSAAALIKSKIWSVTLF